MKLSEVAQPTMSHDVSRYIASLGLLHITTLSASGGLIVDGSVKIPRTDTSLPFPFESVSGDFECNFSDITSLEGSPQTVGGSFRCSDTGITSLKHAPQTVGRTFYCNHTSITSLEHSPQSVSGNFDCTGTRITSLAGVPQTVGGSLLCAGTHITSLEHAPLTIGGDLICRHSPIASLKGIHKTHRNWKIGGVLDIPSNCTDIVGLALIDGIKHIRIANLEFDVSDHDPHSFQEQLLDAGLKRQARM